MKTRKQLSPLQRAKLASAAYRLRVIAADVMDSSPASAMCLGTVASLFESKAASVDTAAQEGGH